MLTQPHLASEKIMAHLPRRHSKSFVIQFSCNIPMGSLSYLGAHWISSKQMANFVADYCLAEKNMKPHGGNPLVSYKGLTNSPKIFQVSQRQMPN